MIFTNQFKKLQFICVCTAVIAMGTVHAQPAKQFGKNAPAYINELPFGPFRSALDALPAKARGKALRILQKGHFSEMDLPYLRVDSRGGVFFEDPVFPVDEIEETTNESSLPEEISFTDAFNLNSKPGASRTVYVDFDGYNVTGTVWNNSSGYSNHPMKPFSTNSDTSTFTLSELNIIADVWRRMAEDLAPYDVNVTTKEPAVFDSTVGHILVTSKSDENGNPIYSCGCGDNWTPSTLI